MDKFWVIFVVILLIAKLVFNVNLSYVFAGLVLLWIFSLIIVLIEKIIKFIGSLFKPSSAKSSQINNKK